MQLFQWFRNEGAQSTIIILGYVMAGVLNPLVNLWYAVLFFTDKEKLQQVPAWIRFSNAAFLLLQIIYILYLNGR